MKSYISAVVAAVGMVLFLTATPVAAVESGGGVQVAPPASGGQSRSSRPTIFVGIAYNFGGGSARGDLGITLKVLSSDRRNRAVAAAGVTFFPWGDDIAFGLDAGIGYAGRNVAAIVGYDFLNASPQISAGWAHTRRRATSAAPPPPGGGNDVLVQ